MGESIPLKTFKVSSGTEVFDWTDPKEWNIRDAWIKNSKGEKVLDFGKSSLHVMGCSLPVRDILGPGGIEARLHTLPDQPDWI